jgi:hypothetical protein
VDWPPKPEGSGATFTIGICQGFARCHMILNELASFVVSPLARERLKGKNLEFAPEARRSGKIIRPDDLYML